MPFDIATGTYTEADAVHPLDASATPGVQQATPVTPVASGPDDSAPLLGGVFDAAGQQADIMASGEADARDAMQTAMDARTSAIAHYQAQALPLGGQIGDAMPVPLVPAAATPPAMSDLYPYAGQEPTPAGVGFYHGTEPTLPE